jgi:CelD/BcsL family acetyltransferase involved in cellulose biosynthesis
LTCTLELPILATETLTTVASLNEIVIAWEQLAKRDTVEGFFRTASWYLSWIQNLRPDARPFVIVVRDAGKVVGIAPFCMLRYNSCLWALTFGGDDIACGEYLDILSLPDYRVAVVRAVWSEVDKMQSRWDLLVLGATPAQSNLCHEAQNWAANKGLMLRAESDRISPFANLPASFDEYFSALGKKKRKNLARARRIFQEHGVEIRTYTRPDELEMAIDTLIELHLLRWRSVGKSGTLGQPGFRKFLKDLSKMDAVGDSFRLYIMELQGTPIAAMLNFHYGVSALQFQNGFDPDCELAPHSPGTLLILHAIQRAIEEGLLCYDFLRGAEEYKFHFAREVKRTTTLAIARSLPAKAYLLAKDAGLAVKKFKPLLRKPQRLAS